MAMNKKKSHWACLCHVATYMIPFLFAGLVWWQLLLIFIQHYLQDNTNFVVWFMKFSGSKKFAEPPMSPWSIIVVDNILHILWMALVAESINWI